jgi:hypothetical protein
MIGAHRLSSVDDPRISGITIFVLICERGDHLQEISVHILTIARDKPSSSVTADVEGKGNAGIIAIAIISAKVVGNEE